MMQLKGLLYRKFFVGEDSMGEAQTSDIYEFIAYFHRRKEEVFAALSFPTEKIEKMEIALMQLTDIFMAFIDRFHVSKKIPTGSGVE